MDRGAWWATVHGVTNKPDTTQLLTLPFFNSNTFTGCVLLGAKGFAKIWV